jgi:site-specific DNA recombinase
MQTAAIYARVSSERQKEEHTVESQIESLLDYSRNNGYTVPCEWKFIDEGFSGGNLVRPALESLRDEAASGHLETVIIHSPDRLSRKYAHQALLIEELSRHGVNVIFIKSVQGTTPEEQLLLQFQGMIAEYERAQIVERSRRGKLHKARNGDISVLSGAPYGYNYIKKTDTTNAYYVIIKQEAEVICKIFALYTLQNYSINKIAQHLNNQGIPTRKNSHWERSTVWGILKNPAYKGTACFGKTEQCERKRITKPLREKGGYSNKCSSSKHKPKEKWIKIPVPAIISEETFALAGELLERNKQVAKRRTIELTLLQNIMVCEKCGYSLYRTSTKTSKQKIYYYRCIGSDNYRFVNGRVCSSKPIRQDYLDELVWDEIVKLLESPQLIQKKIDRRIYEAGNTQAAQEDKLILRKEITRIQKSIDKLLDAYQENLITLAELRKRIPELRKRENAKQKELETLEMQVADRERFIELTYNIESFIEQLKETSKNLTIEQKQNILRMIVKEIIVGEDEIRIKHSIPMDIEKKTNLLKSCLLGKGSHNTALWRAFGCWK